MSAYWISTYFEIRDPEKMAAYAELAGPALIEAGGRFIARGMPGQVYERAVMERSVIVEFESVEAGVAAHDSPAYTEALEALGDGAVRDIRIVPGV